MSIFALADFWHWVTNWWPIMLSYGITGLWIAGLVAAGVFLPWISFNVRIILFAIAGVLVLTTASFTVGIKKGADRVQNEWDQSLDKEAADGEQDRKRAADTVRDATPDSVRDDPWNRDGWKERKGD